MVENLKNLITLYTPVFRRIVLVVLPAVAVLIFLAAHFFEAVDPNLGFQVAVGTLLFFMAVLVEHVASNVARIDALEGGIREIKTSVGVQEGVEVYETDHAASVKQRDFIAKKKPRTVRLCEYSSDTMHGQLVDLATTDATETVELLVCHPHSAVDKYQAEHRIVGQMSALSNSIDVEHAKHMGLRIRCYTRPASLRGRNYDNQLIVVGWYTYDRKRRAGSQAQIWGAENPVFVAPQGHPYGKVLSEFFNHVFADLWEHATPLQEALSEYSIEHSISEDWLKQVSVSPGRA